LLIGNSKKRKMETDETEKKRKLENAARLHQKRETRSKEKSEENSKERRRRLGLSKMIMIIVH
jgi:hypothetical protein